VCVHNLSNASIVLVDVCIISKKVLPGTYFSEHTPRCLLARTLAGGFEERFQAVRIAEIVDLPPAGLHL